MLNHMYTTFMKRWIFDDSDEIEIRLPCWSTVINILEYACWLFNSDVYFTDFKEEVNYNIFGPSLIILSHSDFTQKIKPEIFKN